MRFLGLFLSFLFFYQNSAFANRVRLKKRDCNSKLTEIAHVDSLIKKYFKDNEDPYDQFLVQMGLKNQLEAVVNSDLDIQQVEDLEPLDINYHALEALNDECKKYHDSLVLQQQDNSKELDLTSKKSCDEFLISYKKSEAVRKTTNDFIVEQLKKHSDKIAELQKADEFQSLKNVKQYIAFELLNDCDLDKAKRNDVLDIVCNKSLSDVEADGLDKHVQDNMAVVQALFKKINKPDITKLEESCAKLTGASLINEDGSDRKFDENHSYTLEGMEVCHNALANHKKRIETVVENKRAEAELALKKKEEEELAARRKAQEERLAELRRNREANKNKNVYTEKRSKEFEGHWNTTSSRKKRKKFWKTTGTIAAAVGVTGLIGFGLYKLFDSTGTHTTPYVAPTNTYTSPRNFSSYQMNPYEAYRYQQYMLGGYQQSPNWVGYMPDANNTPYTFEFNQ